VPHTYLEKKTFTIAPAPGCRDSHACRSQPGERLMPFRWRERHERCARPWCL